MGHVRREQSTAAFHPSKQLDVVSCPVRRCLLVGKTKLEKVEFGAQAQIYGKVYTHLHTPFAPHVPCILQLFGQAAPVRWARDVRRRNKRGSSMISPMREQPPRSYWSLVPKMHQKSLSIKVNKKTPTNNLPSALKIETLGPVSLPQFTTRRQKFPQQSCSYC